ncbi:MAG: DNA recombination protein RmuC [Clostridia bacterium]|nr:DNA recombination protein RmuC [Clostridia bacterium]
MTTEQLLVLILVFTIVFALIGITVSLLLFYKTKRNTATMGGVDDAEKLAEDVKKEMATTIKIENSMLTGAVNAQTSATKDMTTRIDTFMQDVTRKLEDMKADNAKNLLAVKEDNQRQLELVREDNKAQLEAVRKDNEKQLEKMRETVDEKLSQNLEQRFNQSFKLVGERLTEINNTFNALQGLQHDVNDLNKIFKNVKTRGTWGEVSLESLLSQILTEDQYGKQVKVKRGEDTRVDFAIKLPGTGDGTVYLPIDAKFPIEDYERLVDASVEGDSAVVETYAKALGDAVMKQARSIRDKYINPPATTDFAVMYLPVEGLYAEVVRRTELLGKLQNECKVVVAGPTTLSALLNRLRMGFRSVAIEKKSKEISKLLVQFQKDFDKFSQYLSKLKDNVGTIQKTIDNAQSKSASIGAKLAKVTKIDTPDSVDLLEGFSSTDEIIEVATDFNTEE